MQIVAVHEDSTLVTVSSDFAQTVRVAIFK